MENIMQMWNDLGPYKYYIFVIILFPVFGIIVSQFYKNKTMSALNEWLEQNPDAAKIHTTSKYNPITSSVITVESIDGRPDRQFFLDKSGIPAGFYLNPGTHIVRLSYSSTRPGVLHKTVSTTWGPVDVQIEVEAKKTYELKFDKKAEQFDFTEI